MSSTQVIDKNYFQLGQIVHVLNNEKSGQEEKVFKIKAIINSNFDVNYKLPNSFVCQNKPHLSGYTALHFVADRKPFESSCFNLLIERGADFTIQNDKGYSPLLLVLKNDSITRYNSLSFSYLTRNNMKNSCKYGISSFHVACALNKLDIVDLFLKAGISVDERINDDSPEFPGYTPLHFAAQSKEIETMELLMKNGANMNNRDKDGLTPLHLLVKILKEIDFYDKLKFVNNFCKILPLIHLPDDMGLTKLHISCISNDQSLISKSFINQDEDIDFPIRFDSPVWPGYTPLHVASNFKFETVIILLEKGANLLAKDASGTTPFDLCIEKYNRNQIIQILSSEKRHNLSHIKLTNGTYLLDVLCAMKIDTGFQHLIEDNVVNINTFIPLDSLIWPGMKLLHLAVIIKQRIYSLPPCNVDFTMLNAYCTCPLHFAFRLKQKCIASYILDYHDRIPVNSVDQDNLSHLHIACAMGNSKAIEFLLKNGADPNLPILHDITYLEFLYNKVIRTGSTPFHLAVKWMDIDLLKKFLLYGANINASDVKGITPLYLIFFVHFYESDHESEIRPGVYYEHFLIEFEDLEIIFEQWFKFQTDVLSIYRSTLLILRIVMKDDYLDNVKKSKKLIKKFIEAKCYQKLGLTRLQIACILSDLPMIKEELESGANVNQQIAYVSSVWPSDPALYQTRKQIFCPGDTALHIHSRKQSENLLVRGADLNLHNLASVHSSKNEELQGLDKNFMIAEILLSHGANPNLKNVHNLTPIHLSRNVVLQEILLSNKKFSIVNPINSDGLSHFHLCCKTKNLDLVESYLKAGVNVNATVNYFAYHYAGYSPLHFAIEYSTVEVFELLLKYGADLKIEAANGLTPLLMAINVLNVSVLQMKLLLRSPSIDIQIMRLFKETVLESIFENNDTSFCHNALTTKKIELLLQNGCELNKKDNTGKTFLHKASTCRIAGPLLSLGADINIKDDEGKTPYVYQTIHNKNSFAIWKILFTTYIRELKFAGLFVDQSNKIDYNGNVDNHRILEIEKEKCELDVKLKEKVDLSISVNYIYSEKFVVDYRRMPARYRQALCNFCESDDLEEYFPITYRLVKLQFRKARTRTRLLEHAAVALQSLVNIDLPELCLESIFKNLLHNDDLMNLVRAEYGTLVFSDLPENC